jgi:hypothetical protein
MKDIIETLFSKTITPSTLNVDGNNLIRKILPHLLSSHIDEHEVRQIVSFRVNFLNDKNLKGLLLTQHTIKTFVQQLLADEEIVKTNVLQVMDRFNILNDENMPELYQRPLKPDNPLLYFHLSTENYESYPFLALSFHRALRHVEQVLKKNVGNGSLPKRKAAQRLENIVTPFVHAVRFYQVDKNDKLFTQTPSHNKIEAALKRGQEDSHVRYHKDEVVESYIRDVLAALSNTYNPRSSKNVTRVGWGRQIIYGKKYAEEVIAADEEEPGCSGILPLTVTITFNDMTEAEASEGGYPVEEAEEVFETAANDLARTLALRQLNPSRFQSHWSKQSISLNTYSSYWHAASAKGIDAMTDEELAFLAFLSVLIFSGFAPKKTANITIKEMPSSEEDLDSNTIYCDPHGTRFFYKMADDQIAFVFAQRDGRSPGLYKDSSNIVTMTTGVIEPILKSYIDRTQSYRRTRPFLFIYKTAKGKTQRFSLESFESIGKSLEDNYGPFPSAYAFSRSFFNYSTSRYSVDPVIAAYASDRVTRELRAPIFYTNLTSQRLDEELIYVQTSLLKDIIRNAENCGIALKHDMLFTESSDLDKQEKEKLSFGSKFVPIMTSMRETLSSIKDRIFNNSGHTLVTRYNIFTFYNMLLWELTGGFRQIEVERLDNTDIDVENGLIAVHGKGNRLYRESRLIFMHPFIAKAIRELELCRGGLIQSLISSGKYSPSEIEGQPVAGNTFSLANSRGQLISASSDNVRKFLSDADIQFPYKLNSQRHLLRTFLFDKKIKYKYLAAYFGHQTRGKEFLSYFSLDSLQEMKDAISVHIEELLNELQLEIISHNHVVRSGKA